jgi:cell division septation protein DedD
VLKLLFWSLLCLNAALLAYGQGLLGSFKSAEREPELIRKQLNTDKLQLLTAAAAAKMAPPPAEPEPEAASPAEPAPKSDTIACTEIGNFAANDARRFETLVAPLALGSRQSQDNVTAQEIGSHMVMIPPLGSKDAADKKAAELKELGVSNYFIMNDNSPMKWAISLGVFKSEAAAQTLMAALKKQGVAGAKVVGRTTQVTKVAFRFRDIDADVKAKLDAAAAKFPGLDTHACK